MRFQGVEQTRSLYGRCDLARNTVPLKTFCRVENPGADVRRVPNIRVGFVDAEGQGDRDAPRRAHRARSAGIEVCYIQLA